MTIKIKIIGLEELDKIFKKKEKEIKKAQSIGLTKAAFFMQGEIKESIAGRRNEPTSVDTGRFLNSVDIKISKDNAIIFSDVEYAKHLEYGTTQIKPRKHFNNSLIRNKEKIKEIIKKEM